MKLVKSHHWAGDCVYCGSSPCFSSGHLVKGHYCNADTLDCPFGFNDYICGVAETETDIFYLDFLWSNVLDYDVCVPEASAYEVSPFNYSLKNGN